MGTPGGLGAPSPFRPGHCTEPAEERKTEAGVAGQPQTFYVAAMGGQKTQAAGGGFCEDLFSFY